MRSSELSREPLVIGSDYSRYPMPGQLSLPTREAGERSITWGQGPQPQTTINESELSDAPRS